MKMCKLNSAPCFDNSVESIVGMAKGRFSPIRRTLHSVLLREKGETLTPAPSPD